MSDSESIQPANVSETSDRKDPLFFTSISDSESSPDSEDSLELSESESITDVTPLNSPYCDSPLPQARSSDMTQIKDYYEDPNRGEMNVLMQAIRKLEVERPVNRGKNSPTYRKKKGEPCSADSTRRVDPESSLLKHVISQQGRIKPSSSHDRLLHRRSTVINRRRQIVSAADAEVLTNDPMSARSSKELSENQARRQVKCLSHPTCSPYPYPVLESTVRCGKELKNLDHGDNSAVQGAAFSNSSETIPNIENKVVAH